MVDQTDQDLVWRRREILHFRRQSRAIGADHSAAVRAGVVLLYAHWEGYVKDAARAYVEFVGTRGLRFADLCPPLLRLVIKRRMASVTESKRLGPYAPIADFVANELTNKAATSDFTEIDTESNLNYHVLMDVVEALGLEYAPAPASEMKLLLDERLLKWRNRIAHGSRVDHEVGPTGFADLSKEVDGLMDAFRTAIQNAAAQGVYRR